MNSLVERLYIHIPFCKHICPFCNLHTHKDQGEKLQAQYLYDLAKELSIKQSLLSPLKSLYIGGGTPSQLSTKNITNLLNLIKKKVQFKSNYEFSFEAHPSSIDEEKIKLLADNGVTRFSFGVESFSPQTKLGRYTTIKQLDKLFSTLEKCKIKNINLDLVYNAPKQTLEQWEKELNIILQYPTTHLATYLLILEKSKLSNKYKDKDLDENLAISMWKKTIEILGHNDYQQYEFSNYARKGYTCKHNLATWQGENFLGIGSGASSIINCTHYTNSQSLKWLDEETSTNHLTPLQRANEMVAFNFRHTQGISKKALKDIKGINLLSHHQNTFKKLIDDNWIKEENSKYSPTTKGLLFSDSIAQHFIES